MLSRLQPPNGKWPAAVLVISSNLYEIERNGAWCSITGARVRNSTLFNYLRAAANTGVKVIIRIHPSPGNFMDEVHFAGQVSDGAIAVRMAQVAGPWRGRRGVHQQTMR